METGRRLICWLAVCAVMTVFSVVAIRAAADNGQWASEDALGDVVVSYDGVIRFYENATGDEKDSNPDTPLVIDGVPVSGTNGGLAFDNALNLLVTNTSSNRLVKLLPAPPHVTTPLATIATQAAPRSIAFAGDGTIYVASTGSPATIRRIPATGSCPPGGCQQFTVPTDSTACIGIDLAPDQSTLYYVSGGRRVRTVTGANAATGAASATTLSPTLPNPGTACGIRLLPPVDARCATDSVAECFSTPAPPFPTPSVGGMIVADARNIKRLNSSGAVVQTFNAGSGSDSQKNWIDIALDPNRRDFWGVDAAMLRLAKFRIAGANQSPLVDLPGVPRGVALNGELRAAQTIRIVELSANTAGTATFLQGTPSQHSWSGKLPIAASFAVQAIEVTHDADGSVSTPCAPSLDIRCRLQDFDSTAGNPKPKTYSRGRSVFYREILRGPLSDPDATFEVGIFFPGPTDLSAGTACVVGGTPPPGTALLRDPWPHDLFSFDGTLAFYGGDDGGIVRTKINDTIVVDRADPAYYMQLIKPTLDTVGQIGSALTIAVEVRNPADACNAVAGLNEALILSVTDITPGSPDKGKPLGDSDNIFGILDANGLTWASTANQYRTNLLLDSKFKANHKYRLCVDAPAGQTTNGEPAAGEVCTDIFAKVGSSKK